MRALLSVAVAALLAVPAGSAAHARATDDRQVAAAKIVKELTTVRADVTAAETDVKQHGNAGLPAARREVKLADSTLQLIAATSIDFVHHDPSWFADDAWVDVSKNATKLLDFPTFDYLDLTGSEDISADLRKALGGALEAAHPPCKETSRYTPARVSNGVRSEPFVVLSFVCTENLGKVEIDTGGQKIDHCQDLGGGNDTCTIADGDRIIADATTANPSITLTGPHLVDGKDGVVEVIPLAHDSAPQVDDEVVM
ncbi:MAG TPA: hypothetical protein VGL76_06165 [Gaiellaceae bacterium]|jgi:hypothetical protein